MNLLSNKLKIKLIKPSQHLLFIVSFLILTNYLSASISTIYDTYGTKSNGMGGTYTEIDSHSEEIYYNWAIPITKNYLEWKYEQSNKLLTKYYNLSINNPFQLKNTRLGLLYSSVPNIMETTLNNNNHPTETGNTFNQNLFGLFTSYTIPNKWINIGLRHTFYYEKIFNENGNSNQIDIALFKQITLFDIPLNLGTTIQNITQSPINWSTGYKDTSDQIYSANINSIIYKNKLLISISKYYSKETLYNSNRIGINYYLYGTPTTTPYHSIYAGYNNTILTTGTSLNIDGWLLDYTWSYYNPFSEFSDNTMINEHRLSIGKSFQPFTPITNKKAKNKTPEPQETLFKNAIKTSTIDTSIIANTQLTLHLEKNQCSFFLSNINKTMEHKFNGKFVIEEINYEINLPIFWTIKPPDTNEVIMITIEKTESNKIHISGFIPDDISLFMNNTQIQDIAIDKSFYHKIDTANKKQYRLEIDILSKIK